MLPCPFYIGGEWLTPTGLPTSPVHNPSRGTVIAEVPLGGKTEADAAVAAAAAAFPAWSETPPVERARILFRLHHLLETNFEDLAHGVSLEHGKTLVEARGDVRRGVEMVEFAAGVPSLLMGETIENIARGIDCEALRQPLGVCVGITPFNFPFMVPLWMVPVALVCGNTFVLKPSEKVPLSAIRLVEYFAEAGLPPGVLNLLHGGREAVDALLEHPEVKAVSFVGSTPVAKLIHEKATRHGKRVQANGGAKNHILVMPDAEIDLSIKGVVEAAFGCAGERCMAGSATVAVGAAAEQLVPGLVRAAEAIRVGPTDVAEQPMMGPLISQPHLERVASLVEQSQAEGVRVVCDGRGVRVPGAPGGYFLGATVLDGVTPEAAVAREEVFGPVLNVFRADTLEEALELIAQSPYGNGASIFTSSGRTAREFKHRVKAGMVGVNVGVPASMAWFPFSGWDDSFFGDLHMQGPEGVEFFTRRKVVTSRWFSPGEGSVWVEQ
jgi:malonate-semialdehyde dehydrogenase (acetylating)/methylmalonate-semialdehyde dehydrogenase